MKSFWHSFRKPSSFPTVPTWCIALGTSPPAIEFQAIGAATGPLQRFSVAGDIWLANRAALLRELLQPALTDSEIIAALWERHGEQCLPLLQGMFAFVVWDEANQTCWLVRDQVGARTLYYSAQGARWWIAPRLATLQHKLAPEIDPIALRDYLCCAFVPGDRTMWQGIREVRPGSIVRLPSNEAKTYWHIAERITEPAQSLDWHAQNLRSLLEQVTEEYLPPNEAVGCYLSGGLDSSLVAALARKIHTQAVHTYSIHFGSATPNELEFSSLVAAHCQTQHHIIEITPQQMWDLHAEALSYLDDPIGDPLTVPNLILGRAAKQSVNVILNGEGGDPCFGGPKNQPMLLTNLYESEHAPDMVSAYLASYQKCAADLPRLLRPEIWQAVKDTPSVFAPELSGAGSYLNRLMFINTKYKGADHILTKVSNLTRACGIEGRSPLFDQRVVACSLTIPPEYKLSGATEKAVLKAAVEDLLPPAIIARPKSGMMVPVQYWFRQLWPKQARALLLSKHAKIRPYLNHELIREWLDYRGDTWGRYGVKLWLLVSLELWLQEH